MRVRVVVKNPMWKYKHTFAKHLQPLMQEYETYEGEWKAAKKDWRTPKGEFLLVNGSQTHIINQADVLEAWRQR